MNHMPNPFANRVGRTMDLRSGPYISNRWGRLSTKRRSFEHRYGARREQKKLSRLTPMTIETKNHRVHTHDHSRQSDRWWNLFDIRVAAEAMERCRTKLEFFGVRELQRCRGMSTGQDRESNTSATLAMWDRSDPAYISKRSVRMPGEQSKRVKLSQTTLPFLFAWSLFLFFHCLMECFRDKKIFRKSNLHGDTKSVWCLTERI